MSCYQPLRAIRLFNIEPGKKDTVKVLKGKYDPFEKPSIPNAEFIPIPCGNCIGCRLDYSRRWADRCLLESKYHDNNWFLTLTYDNEHLPPCREGSSIHSLNKDHMRDFMKNLRSKIFDDYVKSDKLASLYYSKKKGSHWRSDFKNDYPDEYDKFISNIPRVRFFGCGEYGSINDRPHMHILLFGANIPDLSILRRDHTNGYIYYISDYIRNIWNNGNIIITKLTWETCAYTARYIVKKQKGINSKKYEELNYEPEFVLMSRKPGIGYQWFIEHPDIVVKNYYIGTKDGSKIVNSNKYFDSIFEKMDSVIMEEIKFERMRKAKDKLALQMEQTSLSYDEFLNSQECHKLASIKSLKRKEV